jgi:hypothetical protein
LLGPPHPVRSKRLGLISVEVKIARGAEPSDTVSFGISFPNAADAAWAILEILTRQPAERYIFENPVLYISFKPFLQALQALDVSALRSTLANSITMPATAAMHLPAYAQTGAFKWNLSHLIKSGSPCKQINMSPLRPLSVTGARDQLYAHGVLDLNQADAVLSALNNEVALIQGPPGTGKTYTGVQLIKTLILNNVQPIILMAQTNHALDNILRDVYDTGVTQDIVRLGMGSEDEALQKLTFKRREQRIRKKAANKPKWGKCMNTLDKLDRVSSREAT